MTANHQQRDDRLTWTVVEAARQVGIGRNSMYDAIRRNEIPHVRVGRRILVLRQPLELKFGSARGLSSHPVK